ncbi:hypothetical protein DCAR_0313256 [Daucus carota subsp. sativus]|uniref:Uncharacterized protein n=1 Tax=Daucus carota subsp. sativus TaxID=79200 RepID=A0AAF0WRD7_DAUCS|nr:hypothetical protein DCAR_0313256 [Daucus carota subsp. sativus]
MDSRSQQPMINLSGSGRKRNKENQSDASLAGIRQQGSENALDLFLQRRAEIIKRSRTIGTSSEFDKNSRATSQVPLSTIDQSASYQSIRRARLSNFDQNPSPGSVLDSTVTNVMPSTNAATAAKRRGRGPGIEKLYAQKLASHSPNVSNHHTLTKEESSVSAKHKENYRLIITTALEPEQIWLKRPAGMNICRFGCGICFDDRSIYTSEAPPARISVGLVSASDL